MPSIAEVLQTITDHHKTILECLERCRKSPYPDSDRISKIKSLADQSADLLNKSRALADEPIKALTLEETRVRFSLMSKQQELSALKQRIQEQEIIQRATQGELSAKITRARSSANQNELSALQTEFSRSQQEFQISQTEQNRILSEKQAEVNQLHEALPQMELRISEARTRRWNEEAPSALAKIETDMKTLINLSGSLERSINGQIEAELIQQTKADFSSKAEHFSEAESYHKKQAFTMLFAMIAMLLTSGVLVYEIFIPSSALKQTSTRNTIFPILPLAGIPTAATTQASALIAQDTASRSTDSGSIDGHLPGNTPEHLAPSRNIIAIERILQISVGRLAILFFLIWALRYFAQLHRSHVEQAIIYRDKRASLGVAEVLMNATPELSQRRDTLKMLTEVYLKFNDSAFVIQRQNEEDFDSIVDKQIKHAKKAADALKPFLDVISKTVGKAADNTKSS